MRSFQDPDFASRFNVMLYREPICVLVLCTDQTSKALQIQHVAAATREILCTEQFYTNLPNTGASTLATPLPGVLLQISGHAPFHVEKILSDFRTAPLNSTSIGCGGASGLTVGPDHQLGLACGGANALVVDDRTGLPVSGGVLTGLGGADETWYSVGDNHYFFGISTPGLLGVADAGPLPSVDPSAISASGSHSVAADPRRNQVYVPIRGNNGTVPPSATGKICSTAKDVFGLAGSDALGCIAIYTAPHDDRR